MLHHLPALTAITAPSAVSYYRLAPEPLGADLGQCRDAGPRRQHPHVPDFGRGADAARQFNIEYRVADAAASPYLALGALIWAGVDGIRHEPLVAAEADARLLGHDRGRARGGRGAPAAAFARRGARCLEALRGGARMVRRGVLRCLSAASSAPNRMVTELTEDENCDRYALTIVTSPPFKRRWVAQQWDPAARCHLEQMTRSSLMVPPLAPACPYPTLPASAGTRCEEDANSQ